MALICAGRPRSTRFCKRKVDELIDKNTGTREAGQQRPGGLRVFLPRASARELHQKNLSCQQYKTLCSTRPNTVERRRGFRRPISSEPAPSHRPWTLSAGATLPTTTSPYHDHFRRTRKTGTFYFAQNRNFLLCLDSLVRGRETVFPMRRRHRIKCQGMSWRASECRRTRNRCQSPSLLLSSHAL